MSFNWQTGGPMMYSDSRTMLERLGYQGDPLKYGGDQFMDLGSGEPRNIGGMPEGFTPGATNWMTSKGYTPATYESGNDNWAAILGPGGAPATDPIHSVDTSNSTRNFGNLTKLFLGAVGGGAALTGLGALGGTTGALSPATASTTGSGFNWQSLMSSLGMGGGEAGWVADPVTGMMTQAGEGAAAGGGMNWQSLLSGFGSPGGPASMLGSGGGTGSNLWNLFQGGLGLYRSNQLSKLGAPTEDQGIARAKLTQLLQDPSSITSTPGYEAGMQAVERAGAKGGYLGSGNMRVGLAKYGGDFYNNTVKLLADLAQPNQRQYGYDVAATDLMGQSLGTIGYSIGKMKGWGS